MPTVFVGEAPARSDVPAFWPFISGSAGDRLARLLGITQDELWRRKSSGEWVFANLFGEPVFKWDRELAIVKSFHVCGDYLRVGVGREVWILVMLGRKVAQAFQDDRPYFKVRTTEEGNRAVVVPHPSGRCRVWNDPKSVKKFRKLMTELGSNSLKGA